jgi:hypothetical protein
VTTGAIAAVAWLLLGLGSDIGDFLAPMRGVTVLLAGISFLLLLGSRSDDGRHGDADGRR